MPVRFGGRGKDHLCPYPYLSPGFQPWDPNPKRRALKGRQIERTKHTKASYDCNMSQLLAPLAPSGRTVYLQFPGLKPWAEFSSPFGARLPACVGS
jgi:hypothetical protein